MTNDPISTQHLRALQLMLTTKSKARASRVSPQGKLGFSLLQGGDSENLQDSKGGWW